MMVVEDYAPECDPKAGLQGGRILGEVARSRGGDPAVVWSVREPRSFLVQVERDKARANDHIVHPQSPSRQPHSTTADVEYIKVIVSGGICDVPFVSIPCREKEMAPHPMLQDARYTVGPGVNDGMGRVDMAVDHDAWGYLVSPTLPFSLRWRIMNSHSIPSLITPRTTFILGES